MERVVGTLFALTLFGAHGKAAAEPNSSRDRSVHESRAKSTVEPSTALPSLDDALAQVERLSSKLLRVADADRDARVSPAELQTLVQRHVQAKAQARFGRLDRDRDGRVTRAEVPKMAAARFARFDVDGDGAFTAAELTTVIRFQAEQRCAALVARYDFDGDGVLTASDVAQNGQYRVSKLDATEAPRAASK